MYSLTISYKVEENAILRSAERLGPGWVIRVASLQKCQISCPDIYPSLVSTSGGERGNE